MSWGGLERRFATARLTQSVGVPFDRKNVLVDTLVPQGRRECQGMTDPAHLSHRRHDSHVPELSHLLGQGRETR